jgi:hypothetical protein
LADKASDVRITTRLVDSPACLVVQDDGMSTQLARMLKQAGQSHQRLFLHRLDLLVQHVHLAAPVVAGAKPGEVDGEDRVLPAAGQPGAVVDQAQGAQRLDERQLAPVEVRNCS